MTAVSRHLARCTAGRGLRNEGQGMGSTHANNKNRTAKEGVPENCWCGILQYTAQTRRGGRLVFFYCLCCFRRESGR